MIEVTLLKKPLIDKKSLVCCTCGKRAELSISIPAKRNVCFDKFETIHTFFLCPDCFSMKCKNE